MILFGLCILLLYTISVFGKGDLCFFSKDKVLPLKAILAIGIVLHHLSYEFGFLSEFHSLGPVLLSIFFFISGYGLMRQFENSRERYLAAFFKKRVLFAVLLPFIISAAVYFAVLQPDINICYAIKVFFSSGNVIVPNSWFVFAILLYYIFFWLSCKLLNGKYVIAVLSVFTIAYILFTVSLGYARHWYIEILVFPFGVIYSKYENKLQTIYMHKKIYMMVAPVCLIAICLFYVLGVKYNELYFMPVYVLINFIVVSLLAKVKIERLSNFRVVKFLSGISYEIYLYHGIIMALLNKDAFKLDNPWAYIFCTLVLTVLSAYLFNKVSYSIVKKALI